MTAEGWNGSSIRQHVEAAAAEAARGHERLDEVCETLDALIEIFRKIVEADGANSDCLASLDRALAPGSSDQVPE